LRRCALRIEKQSLPQSAQGFAEAAAGFFKEAGFSKGESYLVTADSGQILYFTNTSKIGTTFSTPGDTWREGILQGIKKNVPGVNSTTKETAIFSPLVGFGSFGLVQTLPMDGATAAQKSSVAISAAPDQLMQNPLVWALLAALGWVLVVGFLLRAAFLKPIEVAHKLLEAAVSGQSKVSEEALAKVQFTEVQGLVRSSTQWADRLEREKEDLSRRREEDAHRSNNQIQNLINDLRNRICWQCCRILI